MDLDLTTTLNYSKITKSRLVSTKMTAENRTEPQHLLSLQHKSSLSSQGRPGCGSRVRCALQSSKLLSSQQGHCQEGSGRPVLEESAQGRTCRQLRPGIVQRRCTRVQVCQRHEAYIQQLELMPLGFLCYAIKQNPPFVHLHHPLLCR